MKDLLTVGLIQPVINPDISWNESQEFVLSEKEKNKPTPFRLNIDAIIAERVWQEINEGLASLIRIDDTPDIIMIPELHLPISKLGELKRISKRNGVMIIAGLDFSRNSLDANRIRNRGALIVPNGFGLNKATQVSALYFGKTYFTYMERSMFRNVEGVACEEDQEQNMYVFKTNDFGNFGVVICSDVFDIERMILYQGRIHHLFIISLNKDLNTYFAMAESLTRLLYCNVVICNTGYYGGSLAYSPYDDPIERVIYRYHGQKTFTTHRIALPVSSLSVAQGFDFVNDDKKAHGVRFKATPPGYFDKYNAIKARGIITGAPANAKVVGI